MITEIANSLSETIKKRVLDPFIGIFTLSFIFYNWQPLFIIFFSNKEAIQRIEYVLTNHWHGPCNLFQAIGFPLIFTLSWFFLYPFINRYLLLFHDKENLKTIKERKEQTEKAAFQTELVLLRRTELKFASIEQIFFDQYKTLNSDVKIGTLDIIQCPSAHVGDWIRTVDNVGVLAYCDKTELESVGGIVIKKLINGFVLIQKNGEVDKRIFQEMYPSGEINSQYYYLSKQPGKMTDTKECSPSQRLGRFVIQGDIILFNIDMAIE